MQIASGRPGRARTGRRIAVRLALSAAFMTLILGPGCRRRQGTARVPAASDPASAVRVTVALSGRVLDRAARPVPDARVLLFPDGTSGEATETSTDSRGRFPGVHAAPRALPSDRRGRRVPHRGTRLGDRPRRRALGDAGWAGAAPPWPCRASRGCRGRRPGLAGARRGRPDPRSDLPGWRRLRLRRPRPWSLRAPRGRGRGGLQAGPGCRSDRRCPRPRCSPLARAGPLGGRAGDR